MTPETLVFLHEKLINMEIKQEFTKGRICPHFFCIFHSICLPFCFCETCHCWFPPPKCSIYIGINQILMPTPVFHKLMETPIPDLEFQTVPWSQGANESFVKWWEAKMFHQTKAAGHGDKVVIDIGMMKMRVRMSVQTPEVQEIFH